MSIRTIAAESSNRYSASALVSSVLPTPVGPRNRNDPSGRPGSCNPARARRTAADTAFTAASCPITRLPISCSILSSFSRSPDSIRSTGIPVQRLTTAAISWSVTSSRSIAPADACAASASCFSSPGMRPYWISPAFAKSPDRCACSNSSRAPSSASLIFASPAILSFSACQRVVSAPDCSSRLANSPSSVPSRSFDAASVSRFSASRSILSCMIRRSRFSISSGLDSTSIRNRDAASSIRSIALSGKNRSAI